MDVTSRGRVALSKRTPDLAARHGFPAGLFWGLIWMTAIACVAVAQATTVKRMTLSEVVRAAEVIVAGEVASIDDSVWDAERSMPYTEVVFFVNRALKGEVGAGQELRLRFQGGTAPNGLTLTVSGMPTFRPHQRVVVVRCRWNGRAEGLPAGGLVAGPLPAPSGRWRSVGHRPRRARGRGYRRRRWAAGGETGGRGRGGRDSADLGSTRVGGTPGARRRQVLRADDACGNRRGVSAAHGGGL